MAHMASSSMSRNHRDGPAISEHARSECRRLRTSNYIPFSTGVRALSVRFDPTEAQALGQQRGPAFSWNVALSMTPSPVMIPAAEKVESQIDKLNLGGLTP